MEENEGFPADILPFVQENGVGVLPTTRVIDWLSAGERECTQLSENGYVQFNSCHCPLTPGSHPR